MQIYEQEAGQGPGIAENRQFTIKHFLGLWYRSRKEENYEKSKHL